jgi:hypothetical protein
MIRAQQMFHEIYGKRIEAAKTPEAKAALAKELLELARKESDLTAKLVELENARRLAIEAEDIALSVEIVRELATTPARDLPDDLLSNAESLWLKSRTWVEKLDAIELYFRSAPSPLVKQVWDERVAQLVSHGKLEFLAKDAKLVGGSRMAYWSDLDAILYWDNPLWYIEWRRNVPPGEYTITIEYAADPPMAAGSLFEIALFRNERARVPVTSLRFVLGTTGPWATFVSREIGKVKVTGESINVVRLRVLQKNPPTPVEQGLIAPRKLIFRRLR